MKTWTQVQAECQHVPSGDGVMWCGKCGAFIENRCDDIWAKLEQHRISVRWYLDGWECTMSSLGSPWLDGYSKTEVMEHRTGYEPKRFATAREAVKNYFQYVERKPVPQPVWKDGILVMPKE